MSAFWPASKVVWAPRLTLDISVKLANMKKQKPALTQPPAADKNSKATAAASEASRPDPLGEARSEDKAALRPADPAAAAQVKLANMEKQNATRTSSSVANKAEKSASPETEDKASGKTGETASSGGGVPPQPVNPSAKTRDEEPRKRGAAALVLALVALAGVGLVGWQVWELRQAADGMRTTVADRFATAEERSTESLAMAKSTRESVDFLQGRFGAIESRVEKSEGQAAALESMYQEFSRSRSDRALAEVDQAISIAGQQLRLAGNYEAALIALQSAEARLASPEMAHLHDLRKALVADIDAVKAHPRVDVSGLALQLDLLIGRIEELPLAYAVEPKGSPPAVTPEATEPAPENASTAEVWWNNALVSAQRLGAEAWNEMRGMVRLERLDGGNDPALLSPQRGVFLRDNIKLRLMSARLALLASDARTYSSDLKAARALLERYFDTRNDKVIHVLNGFEELENIKIEAEAPSLTRTFSALGMVRAQLSAGAER